jgi:hypothetical protein
VDPTWDRHQGASRAFRGFFLTRSAKGPRKRESGSNNRKVVLV